MARCLEQIWGWVSWSYELSSERVSCNRCGAAIRLCGLL